MCFLFFVDYIKIKEYFWIENKYYKLNKILYIDYNIWEEDLIYFLLFVCFWLNIFYLYYGIYVLYDIVVYYE